MDRDEFRQVVEQYLVPLFSGARLLPDFEISSPRHAPVVWRDPCAFYIKPEKHADYRVVLVRSQPFANSTSPGVSEYRVIQAFVTVLAEISASLRTTFEQDVLAHFVQRIVVRSICGRRSEEAVILATINQLTTWSNRLYEGKPIAACVGFLTRNAPCTVTLSDIWHHDFSSVLTNGADTLIVANYHGNVLSYEALSAPRTLPLYAPHRLAPIAEWTQQGRIALVLNRSGEVLVLQDQQLIFARRGGRWHLLMHDPVITQMGCPQDQEVRRAVYSSCLDASFARTGACVGVMSSGDVWRLGRVAPERNDHIQPQLSPKAKAIHQMLTGQRFQDLDRRLRQELLAIDGATIIDYMGNVLAVGAILQIEGGSSGGGRLAAAIELSKCGVGIKVSQDGGIKGFRRCQNQASAEPCFFVM